MGVKESECLHHCYQPGGYEGDGSCEACEAAAAATLETLEKWGRHTDKCVDRALECVRISQSAQCTCGFTAAKDQARKSLVEIRGSQ